MRIVLVILRGVVAVIVGYAVMVVLITLVQEVWLGGVGYRESSLGVLAVAGSLTFLSAVVGGAVGGLIGCNRPRAHALGMVGLNLTEATALLVTGEFDGPAWFDCLAVGSLVAGILLGGAVIVPWLLGLRGPSPINPDDGHPRPDAG